MEPQMPDPVPSIMRWRFKQLKKLLKETVTMTPNNGQATVKPGQRIIVDLPFSPNISDKRILFSSPERGDVIVFKTPEDNDTDYIKRLIGLPGDKIQMLNGVLNINNKPIKREFIKNDFVLCGGTKIKSNFYQETLPNGKTYLAAYSEKNSSKDTDVYLIPQNKFFFMGDNRDCSQDSRYLSSVGYVDKINLVGKAQILFRLL